MLTTMVASTRVAFTGAVNQLMTFGMQNSEYIIKRIDGLGPVAAEVISSPNAIRPGNTFLSARDTQRNIVITFGFNPKKETGNTIESLRRSLSKVFTPKMRVNLTFSDDQLGIYYIDGTVETNEPDIFAKDPEVQISILCDDPYFQKFGASDVEFVVPPVTVANPDFVLPYESDVPTGFSIEFDVAFSTTTFAVLFRQGGVNGYRPQLRIDMDFNAGDRVRISTVKGEFAVTYKRGTGTTPVNAMGSFSGSLTGMVLEPGPNYFTLLGGVGTTYVNNTIRDAVIRYPSVLGSL